MKAIDADAEMFRLCEQDPEANVLPIHRRNLYVVLLTAPRHQIVFYRKILQRLLSNSTTAADEKLVDLVTQFSEVIEDAETMLGPRQRRHAQKNPAGSRLGSGLGLGFE